MTRLMIFPVAALLTLIMASCAPRESVRTSEEPSQAVKTETPELPPPFLAEVMSEPVARQAEAESPRKPIAARVEAGDDGKNIILNFENADINTVIQTVGDILGINYILPPGISGQVTIQSNHKFPVNDLFSVFQAVLELNNLTAVKDGNFYMITPLDQAKGLPLPTEKGREIEMSLDAGFVTQIVTLEYVKATDASNILRNLLPKGADLVVYEPTNLLIITARPASLARLMKVLEAVDIAETETDTVKTFVYYAEHGEAKSLAEILKAIYGTQGQAKAATQPVRKPVAPPATGQQQRRPATPAAPSPVASAPTLSEVSGDIAITTYDDINAIIIKTTAKNYLEIVESLRKLDTPRKQVLIDVMVAEVTLGESEKYGVEWLVKASDSSTTIGGGSGSLKDMKTPVTNSAGLFTTIFSADKFNYFIGMFASQDKLKVLSSPSVLATDTKEARIEVGDEVPTATGTLTSDSTSGNLTSQIQYKTTGTILEVTPTISEKGMVTLKISQEISNVSTKATSVGGKDYPTFNSRKAKTTAIVQNGHTLVIGGLISEKKISTNKGIPYLSSIPYIGWLFGSIGEDLIRTELLIMVTPHVVGNPGDGDSATEQFRNKLRHINKRLEY
ncbi:MAG: hypothetical protein HZA20_04210 [Nitrospirae bacterium]|nr:hypothetical protein [Nitrospirota bacterium]